MICGLIGFEISANERKFSSKHRRPNGHWYNHRCGGVGAVCSGHPASLAGRLQHGQARKEGLRAWQLHLAGLLRRRHHDRCGSDLGLAGLAAPDRSDPGHPPCLDHRAASSDDHQFVDLACRSLRQGHRGAALAACQ